jgi:hypothetical protein
MSREKIAREKLGLFLAAEAKTARETMAETCFSKDTVSKACTEAALGGFPGCVIKPPAPVNLRDTNAAKSLETWLRGQGLQSTWIEARDTPDGPDYPRLEITWNAISLSFKS